MVLGLDGTQNKILPEVTLKKKYACEDLALSTDNIWKFRRTVATKS